MRVTLPALFPLFLSQASQEEAAAAHVAAARAVQALDVYQERVRSLESELHGKARAWAGRAPTQCTPTRTRTRFQLPPRRVRS